MLIYSFLVNALRSETIYPANVEHCANYPKGLPFPTKRFATELLCCVKSIQDHDTAPV